MFRKLASILMVLLMGTSSANAQGTLITTASGLRYNDTQIGTGAQAVAGKKVQVQYTGWLLEANDSKGTQFDSSYGRGQPFAFNLGAGQVIRGWDEGVMGMKEGGKRTLLIPSKLGYGARGIGPIPPNADLIFEVELIKVE